MENKTIKIEYFTLWFDSLNLEPTNNLLVILKLSVCKNKLVFIKLNSLSKIFINV